MKDHELVTVIVPVYNRAHLITRAIGSLCAQSYQNLEILIIDDCSSDDIEAVVAMIDDPRIRLVRRSKNGGAAAARNTGIAEAGGSFIAFHDSDDICVFDKIERQLKMIHQLPDDYIGVYCAALFHYNLDEESYSKMQTSIRPFSYEVPLSGELFERTLKGNSFNLPTLLVKKTALVAAGPSDELMRNNVDWDLALRLTRQGKLGFITEPLYLVQVELSRGENKQRISRSARYSAQSFARITGKIRRAGFSSPSLSGHYASAARHLLRLKKPYSARRFLCAALAITPLAPKLWAHYVFSFYPSLHVALQYRWRSNSLPK